MDPLAQTLPRPRKDPKSRSLNSGPWYSHGVDGRTAKVDLPFGSPHGSAYRPSRKQRFNTVFRELPTPLVEEYSLNHAKTLCDSRVAS